jgi:hypothetical protein
MPILSQLAMFNVSAPLNDHALNVGAMRATYDHLLTEQLGTEEF